MNRIEHVGVREFRDRATYYLKRGKPLAIERHGEVIGYFLPVRRRDPEGVHPPRRTGFPWKEEEGEETVQDDGDRSLRWLRWPPHPPSGKVGEPGSKPR